MRIPVLALLLLLSMAASAQSYNCVSEYDIRYFTNDNHYLRAIRIDSVKDNNGTKILYPFKTARGYFWRKNILKPGGSWLGNEIRISADGVHLFSNYYSDTIVIKSTANLNDSWIFYDDTSAIYYTATVTAIDTMNVLGVIDSVKVITLSANDASGSVTSDSFHNRKIIISKNQGFVQVFDLYVFPQQRGRLYDGDYLTWKAKSLDFRISSFKNPERLEIYDFKEGDIFQRYDASDNRYGKYTFSYITDSVMQKKQITGNHIQYTLHSNHIGFLKNAPYGTKEYFTDTSIINVYSGNLLDMTFLPEEWGCSTFIEYNYQDTNFCFTDKSYTSTLNYVYYYGDSADVNTFEPCGGPNNRYKVGLGVINYSHCQDPTGSPPHWFLIYTNKNSTPCRNHYNSISGIDKTPGNVVVFPNPAKDRLTIEFPQYNTPMRATLYNISGQKIWASSGLSATITISTSNYTPGLYLLSITGEDGTTVNKRIVINR